jgi:hypothetical protein
MGVRNVAKRDMQANVIPLWRSSLPCARRKADQIKLDVEDDEELLENMLSASE